MHASFKPQLGTAKREDAAFKPQLGTTKREDASFFHPSLGISSAASALNKIPSKSPVGWVGGAFSSLAVRVLVLLVCVCCVGVGVRCCACALVLLCSLLRAREPSRRSISPLTNLAQLASLSSGLLADASCALPTHSAHSSPLPHERTYATRASERFTGQSCKAVHNLYSEISL